MHTVLDVLPEEIWIRVLYDLDAAGILNCKKVCRKLSRMIDNAVVLQYKVELGRAGMIDAHRSDLTYADRLAMLRAFLRESNPTGPSLFTVPGLGSDSIPELEYPSFDAHQYAGWNLKSGDVVMFRKDRQLWIVRPASPRRAVAERLWTISPENDIHDRSFRCHVDSPQDLVVMTEVHWDLVGKTWSGRCFLYSITTGQPHPLAAQPTLHIDGIGILQATDAIQIHEDLIAWAIYIGSSTVTHLRVWNWKTGDVMWDHRASQLTRFFLLNEHNVFGASEECITIHTIGPPSPSISVLQFPPLVPGGSLSMAWFHGYNTASAVPQPFGVASSGSPAFVSDPALRIIAIYYGLKAPSVPVTEHFLFLIPVSSVLSVAASLRSIMGSDPKAPATVPWNDWGRSGVRCVRLCQSPYWLSVHGSRAILGFLREDQGSSTICDLLAFDVHPHANQGRRPENGDKEETSTSRFILPLEKSQILSSPAQVCGTFPYRATHTKVHIQVQVTGAIARTRDIIAMEDGVVFVVFFTVGGQPRKAVLLRA